MQIISLISGKGGVGKTTLAANLAVALAQRQKRVVLIDLDPQNTQRLHLGMDADEIAGFAREGIFPTSMFDSPFEIKFIPFGRVSEAELEEFEAKLKLDPHWIRNGIEGLDDGSIDFVILDTPPGATVYLQQALLASQRTLVVVLADAASYATLPKIISLVAHYTTARTDFNGAHILINQMPERSKLGHQIRTALYADYASQIIPIAVRKDRPVAEALAFERPVLRYAPHCKASSDLQTVTDWLLDSIDT